MLADVRLSSISLLPSGCPLEFYSLDPKSYFILAEVAFHVFSKYGFHDNYEIEKKTGSMSEKVRILGRVV